jgi:hypothetical protein
VRGEELETKEAKVGNVGEEYEDQGTKDEGREREKGKGGGR